MHQQRVVNDMNSISAEIHFLIKEKTLLKDHNYTLYVHIDVSMGAHHCDRYNFFLIFACLQSVFHGSSSQVNDACSDIKGNTEFKRFQNSCFWVSMPPRAPAEWNIAQAECADHGGNLATVVRQETLEFLRSNWNITNSFEDFWIGLYIDPNHLVYMGNDDQRRQADWKWIDGTQYGYRDSIGWYYREPEKNETLGCLRNLKWASVSEGKVKPFICEIKFPSSTTQFAKPSAKTLPFEPPDELEEETTLATPYVPPQPVREGILGTPFFAAIGVALVVFAAVLVVGALVIKKQCAKSRSKTKNNEDDGSHYCDIKDVEVHQPVQALATVICNGHDTYLKPASRVRP